MRANAAQKGKRAATSAARNFIRARLGWLNGYPEASEDTTAVTWRALPLPGSRKSAENLEISRELLRKSEFARNAARRRFPHALQNVVGDVSEWTRSTDARLNILKATVHDGTPLPGLAAMLAAADLRRAVRIQINELHRGNLSFAPLLTALVWRHWEDVEALKNSISQLDMHRDSIAILLDRLPGARRVAEAMACLDLVCDGCDPWFLDLLRDPRIWDLPLSNGAFPACLQKCIKTLKSDGAAALDLAAAGFARPPAKFATDLLDQISRLAGLGQPTRDHRLRLLRLLIPDDIAPAWANWWLTADKLERELKINVHSGWAKATHQERIARKALSKRIGEELEPLPVVNLRKHGKTLDRLSSIKRHKAVEAMLDCLSALPGSLRADPAVATFLEHWLDVLENPATGRNQAVVLLRAQQRLLGDIPDDRREQHIWATSQLPEYLCDTWIDQKKSIKHVEPAIAALTQLLSEHIPCHKNYGPLRNYFGWDSLVDAAGIMNDPRDAADAICLVPPDSCDFNGEIWAAMLRQSGPCMQKFATMAKTWQSHSAGAALCDEALLLFQDPSLSLVVTSTLLLGEGKRLARAIALSALARSLAAEFVFAPPPDISLVAVLTHYPEVLHPLLQELALWDRNFCQAVDQILGNDFPDRRQLEAELATVNRLADTAEGQHRRALLARANTLSRQLSEPPAVSGQRIVNLQTKLDQRLHHARMVEWERLLLDSVRCGLKDKSGQVPPDQFFDDADTILVLSGLASLSSNFKNLAYQLLTARNGPAPWDLRDHRANRAFIARMQQHYQVGPWLDGIGQHHTEIDDQSYTVELVDDPLQVMQMGQQFSTCLSPGSFNFFSAVSNAADINKRVIYVRNEKGTVQGRCLVAITDEFHLLAFHIYAHAHQYMIEAAVKQFVQNLCEAIGTSIVATGHVSTLVAPDWYDDGPIDLTGRLGKLGQNSEFGQALAKAPVGSVIPMLREILQDHPITPSLVSLLLDTAAFYARPELVLPLLPFVHQSGELDPWTRIKIAERVCEAGEPQTALELIKPLLKNRPTQNEWIQGHLAELLLRLNLPQRALEAIRRSRPEYVRGWEDELPFRTSLAADAYIGLNRPTMALTLYRLAGAYGDERAKQRAAKLEMELNGAL